LWRLEDDGPMSAQGARVDDAISAVPGYEPLKTAQGMGGLLLRTMRVAVRPPYSWWGDCVEQCAIGLRRCFMPLTLSITFFSIGVAMVTIGDILQTLGTVDRLGGGLMLGFLREVCFWITGMVFAGVVGAAVTADLGARKIREELDAVQVLGVDPVRSLVVPRVVALIIIAPILGVIAMIDSLITLYLLSPVLLKNLDPSVYLETSKDFMTIPDLWSMILKLMVTGLMVGVVACYKGLSTKGGAEGVGRAVNQSVVITFLGVWALNSLWNAVFLASFPTLAGLRG
jgi:phospholipid/cholesterol/gamma-HCH transport system permease protein